MSFYHFVQTIILIFFFIILFNANLLAFRDCLGPLNFSCGSCDCNSNSNWKPIKISNSLISSSAYVKICLRHPHSFDYIFVLTRNGWHGLSTFWIIIMSVTIYPFYIMKRDAVSEKSRQSIFPFFTSTWYQYRILGERELIK